MGFIKTSVSVTRPQPVSLPEALSPEEGVAPPEVGEVRDGLMWDGDKWVPIPEDRREGGASDAVDR